MPELAQSIANMGMHLAALGRTKEALAAGEASTRHYRNLARTHPDAFAPDLAMSLNNVSNRLAELHRQDEAVDAVEQAIVLLTPYFQAHPLAFATRMEMLCVNYTVRCGEAGCAPRPDLRPLLAVVHQTKAANRGESLDRETK